MRGDQQTQWSEEPGDCSCLGQETLNSRGAKFSVDFATQGAPERVQQQHEGLHVLLNHSDEEYDYGWAVSFEAISPQMQIL